MKTWKKLKSVLLIFALFSESSWAQKVNFDLGAYSIAAKSPQGPATADLNLSNFGTFAVSANFVLRPTIEIGVGYSLFFSNGISGDMGFGPDLFLYIFPFNEGSGLVARSSNVEYREIQQWRPYGYGSFHQRQFQSAQSAYSGFGFGAGTEWQWSERTAFRGGIRSMNLTGPSKAKFEYLDLTVGIQFQFH